MAKKLKKRIYHIICNEEYLSEKQILETLNDKVIVDYAYIMHDKDRYTNEDYNEYIKENNNEKPLWKVGDFKKRHWHIFIRLTSPTLASTIAKKFKITEERVRRADSPRGTLEYLIHLNHKDKFQYSADEVNSNFDYRSTILETTPLTSEKRLEEIARDIGLGLINEYNVCTCGLITINEYRKYLTDIKRMLEFDRQQREAKMQMEGRNMKVIFIQGKKGSGKTTYAKYLASKKGLDYYVSSSSNDLLDGYKGQPCLILDDLRGSSMQFADLLKLLDNNTSSSVKSRYYNKVLFCELIIITTIKDIGTFYSSVFENDDEPREQFFRRCETVIEMDREKMDIYSYNKDSGYYDYIGTSPNPIKDKVDMYAKPLEERRNDVLSYLDISYEKIEQQQEKKARVEDDPFEDF